MHIASVAIHSYKSFIDPAIINLSANFNIIIGANNSGKTNIVDAIEFLTRPQTQPVRLHHHRSDIDMVVVLSEEERSHYAVSSPIHFRGNQYNVTVTDAERTGIGANVSSIAQRVKRLRLEDFSDIGQIEQEYSDLAQNHPDVFMRLTKLLQSYFPEIESVERIMDVTAQEQSADHTNRRASITIERLGEGFRRVLVMLLYALHPSYSVIMIDEPEIHLHPGMIRKVHRILSSTEANQIIVTSHSPLFITADKLGQVYRVLRDARGSHVFYLAQGTRVIDQHRLVQELNADNLEMFFADKVLVVEGVSDRILMRGLIDRFYQGHDDVKVIDTHGKSNIDIYLSLMDVFHIPYLILLDRDALYAMADAFKVRADDPRRTGESREQRMIEELRARNVFILSNGTIEHNYPRHYQHHDSKPLNALYAAANITSEEYHAPGMQQIKAVIDAL